MAINSYRQDLADELQSLKQRSIACRRQLEMIAHGVRFGGDALDTEQLRQKLQAELLYLDQQKARLRYALGVREPAPAVKLNVKPAVKLGTPSNRRLDAVKRALDGGGYLSRALGSVK